MKIYGICLVKNEEDIIEETLCKASAWCDKIIVDDSGSIDRTWERVCAIAESNPRVVPFQKKTRAFNDRLRADAFNAYRAELQPGDWWAKLDADEIYIDDPKSFLQNVPRRHHVVGTFHLQYYLTEKEAALYDSQQRDSWLSLPAEERLSYYICDAGEPRFFRHRSKLEWTNGSWPRHMGVMHPCRIRVKHLQYRSPEQIAQRLATRQEASRSGWKNFDSYESENHWREKVRQSESLCFDDRTGNYIINQTLCPRLIEKPLHRCVKYVMHGIGLWP